MYVIVLYVGRESNKTTTSVQYSYCTVLYDAFEHATSTMQQATMSTALLIGWWDDGDVVFVLGLQHPLLLLLLVECMHNYLDFASYHTGVAMVGLKRVTVCYIIDDTV